MSIEIKKDDMLLSGATMDERIAYIKAFSEFYLK